MSSEELKKLLDEKKSENIVFGSERTVKGIKSGKISKVFLPVDCSIEKKEMIKELAKKKSVSVIELENTKEELKEVMKKPFLFEMVSLEK